MPKSTGQSRSPDQSRYRTRKIVKGSARERRTSYPIALGETVTVLRFGVGTVPFIEGAAVVKNVTAVPHCYDLQFVGEHTVRRRVVYREFQHEPERLLAMLLSIWRGESAVAADINDFFPDGDLQTRG